MLEVNPVYYDVPQAHLVAAIDAQLEQLDKAGAIISSSVNSRVQEYRARLDDLRKRLQVARRKVERIAQSKQGIVIYSAGSYPLPKEKQEEKFKRLIPLGPVVPSRELEEIYRPPIVSSKNSEGLKFLHVKPPASAVDENVYRLPPKGLGSFQKRGIKNVSDLLLFNSAINPYSEELPVPEPDPAPVETEPLPPSTMGTALSFPSQLGDENVDGLLYDPGKSTTPQLSLPANLVFGDGFVTDLPDLLPGGPMPSTSFAPPSMFSQAPAMDAFQQPPTVDEMDDLPQLPGVLDSEPVLPVIAPPPPPPMPPPMPVGQPAAAAASPPPMPPPMPSASSPPTAPVPPPAPSTPAPPAAPPPPKSTPSPAGDRTSLLDSIRNHGGLRGLKSVKDNTRKAPAKKPAQAPKLDHMAQLKERLQRIGEISTGLRPRPAEVAPPPPKPGNILEEMLNNIKSRDIVGSDTDDSDAGKDNDDWD